MAGVGGRFCIRFYIFSIFISILKIKIKLEIIIEKMKLIGELAKTKTETKDMKRRIEYVLCQSFWDLETNCTSIEKQSCMDNGLTIMDHINIHCVVPCWNSRTLANVLLWDHVDCRERCDQTIISLLFAWLMLLFRLPPCPVKPLTMLQSQCLVPSLHFYHFCDCI